MSQTPLNFAETHQKENLSHLIDLLRIPSISTDPKHRSDVERAADWLVNRMKEIGLNRVEAIPTAGHPVVYGEWLGRGDEAPTLLVYGHYDVQPTAPDEEWATPPFSPIVRDGNLYARGASDDKGQLYINLAAAEAFFQTEGGPPINLKFMIEGEEEVGSINLESFIHRYTDLLSCDAALISDTSMLNAQTPALVYGVRGLVYVEMEVQGPKGDLHSGLYGGVAHNPLQVAVELLAALHDEQGRVAIPGFYDDVLPLTKEERDELNRVPFDETEFLNGEVGAPALWTGEEGYTPLERIGARPTLEIHGIRGGFIEEGSKTVIPAQVTAKVSMRLVPEQDPLEIFWLFKRHVQELAPPTVKVEVRSLGLADAAIVDRNAPAMQAAVQAYRQGFGTDPVFLRSGGSIPVVTMIDRILEVPVILMGYGLPDDNLHAPNEKFNLDNFYRGIKTSIHFMNGLAATE